MTLDDISIFGVANEFNSNVVAEELLSITIVSCGKAYDVVAAAPLIVAHEDWFKLLYVFAKYPLLAPYKVLPRGNNTPVFPPQSP